MTEWYSYAQCQQCAEGVPLEDGYHVKSTVGPNYRIDSKTLCLAHLKNRILPKGEVMKKFFTAFTFILALAISSVAKTYSTPVFSATFNGDVKVETFRNSTNSNTAYSSFSNGITKLKVKTFRNSTSSNTAYSSFSNGITELVVVRTVDHDIDVNTTSSQFYRANTTGATLVDKFNSDGEYQGHPYSYGLFEYTDSGIAFTERERIIIVNSRTVIFIKMIMTAEKASNEPNTPGNDLQVWQDFENTLNIK